MKQRLQRMSEGNKMFRINRTYNFNNSSSVKTIYFNIGKKTCIEFFKLKPILKVTIKENIKVWIVQKFLFHKANVPTWSLSLKIN